MAMAGIIKKYKRTLTNFQEDFMVPLIKKAAFRYMQFDPERYPSVDMKFIPSATLGIMAREYEQQQLIGLLQTLGPNTPVLPIILKGIIGNSSLSNRAELEQALTQMSQPDPQQAQMQQMALQMDMQQKQATTQSLQARAQRDSAEAAKTVVETQLMPEELRAKVISSLSTNIDGKNQESQFTKRAKIAEFMLKDADIKNKGKIVELQMQKQEKTVDKKLQRYYEDRFTMTATQGWLDLMEDAQNMFNSLNNVLPIQTETDLHLKRGQLDILQWLLSLKAVSEQTYEQLLSGDTANE